MLRCGTSDTSCGVEPGVAPPTRGIRLNVDQWILQDGETDFNPEGGLCGMPTQFLGSVRAGGRHRTPRWILIFQDHHKHRSPFNDYQKRAGGCEQGMSMFLPWQLMNLTDCALPTSAALTRFLGMAWHGVDSVKSAWDSCENDCMIPVSRNRMCSAADTPPQLTEYDWSLPYCDAATGVVQGTSCCSLSCGGICQYDSAACADRPGGADLCCPNRIATLNRPCESSDDVGCVVPTVGNGAACNGDTDCTSGSCKGGRCCDAYGQGAGCTACDQHGHCAACTPELHGQPNTGSDGGTCTGCNYTLQGPMCVSSCDCKVGCSAGGCNCGCCTGCEGSSFLDIGGCTVWEGEHPSDTCGLCQTRKPVGDKCISDTQCVDSGTGARCAGGNCCDTSVLKEGCLDCNFRGLCEGCDTGYTLCDHLTGGDGGNGQCNVTLGGSHVTSFMCGVGPDGDAEGHPLSFSTNDWDYCGGGKCLCRQSGCYQQCDIAETCWRGSDAHLIHDRSYYPPSYPDRTTSEPTPARTTSEPTPSPTPPYCREGYGDYGVRYNWGIGKITIATSHEVCSARCTQYSGPQYSGGCKGYMTGMYYGMLFCRAYGGDHRTQPCAPWAKPGHAGVGSGAVGYTHPTTNQENIGGNCCSNSTFVSLDLARLAK